MRHSAWATVTVAVAALLMVGTLAVPSRAGPTVRGDQTAWQEITAAFQRLEATSYRMRMTAPGQMVITEHVPPDSTRVTTRITGAGESESITIGNETRYRVSVPGVPDTWLCNNAGPRPPVSELKDLFSEVEVSRRPDTVIAGAPVHTYNLTSAIRGGDQTAKTTTIIYVGIQTGLPRRSVTRYPLSAEEVVIDYYDYGAPITITLPACP